MTRKGKANQGLWNMSKNYWQDRPATGDYGIDCIIGAGIADQVIQDMQSQRFPPLLGYVALTFFRNDPSDRQEISDGRIIGFFHRIAERAAWPQ
jgi:hypothetical protein